MRFHDLPGGVLEEIGVRAVENAWTAVRERGGVLAAFEAPAGRFDTDKLDGRLVDEFVKQADRVRAATDAGDRVVGQASFVLQQLRLRLAADNRLEVAHNRRVRVGP